MTHAKVRQQRQRPGILVRFSFVAERTAETSILSYALQQVRERNLTVLTLLTHFCGSLHRGRTTPIHSTSGTSSARGRRRHGTGAGGRRRLKKLEMLTKVAMAKALHRYQCASREAEGEKGQHTVGESSKKRAG